MDEEPNPIKDILYESINELGEDYLQKNILKGNISETINEILFKTHNKVGNLEGDSNVNIGKLLTSLLHYLLTLVLIPSQRKISKNDIDIDIVIPNLKTLETKPGVHPDLVSLSKYRDEICQRIEDGELSEVEGTVLFEYRRELVMDRIRKGMF